MSLPAHQSSAPSPIRTVSHDDHASAPRPTSSLGLALIVILNLVVALSISTQVVAAIWHHHPRLGIPLWSRATPQIRLYPPHAVLIWAMRYQLIPDAAPGLRLGGLVGGSVFVLGLMLSLTVRRRRHTPRLSISHGSAAWGTGATLRHADGLILGRYADQPLRYREDGHLLTVAPTRAGKGVSVLIPNLLTYPGTMIVTDPKAENYAVTARYRRALGHRVYAFDPFQVIQTLGLPAPDIAASWNPLDLIAPTAKDAVDDARMMADMLVMADDARQQSGEQAFWNEEARGVLAGLILHVASARPAGLRHLAHVRELLTLPPDEFAVLLQEMSQTEAVGGLVARAAARLLQKAEKERSGVISSAQSHTHFLDSPRMADVLTTSTFDLGTLTSTPMTMYLIIPPDRLPTYQRWVRLMLGCCLLSLTRSATDHTTSQQRTVFLLDEFAHLGRMAPIEQQMTLVAGYGATLWLLVQDFAQLKQLYGDRWQSFVANAAVLQAFGIADHDTAEYLSKLTGDSTIRVASENAARSLSYGKSRGRQMSAAQNVAEKGRRLLFPDEVRRLSHQLLFVRGHDPICADRIAYFKEPRLQDRADPNPYVTSRAPAH